jgi:hypothetical protein
MGMDEVLRALKYRAWHRGTREADMMIGGSSTPITEPERKSAHFRRTADRAGRGYRWPGRSVRSRCPNAMRVATRAQRLDFIKVANERRCRLFQAGVPLTLAGVPAGFFPGLADLARAAHGGAMTACSRHCGDADAGLAGHGAEAPGVEGADLPRLGLPAHDRASRRFGLWPNGWHPRNCNATRAQQRLHRENAATQRILTPSASAS